MSCLVYYVATSLDGYIADKTGGFDKFLLHGDHAEFYTSELSRFSTVIMGRKTYEVGFQYGLSPGQPAYPGMDNWVFTSRSWPEGEDVHFYSGDIVTKVKSLKEAAKKDVYLCGGGQLAKLLLENSLVDQVYLKVNPVILGEGIRVFADVKPEAFTLIESRVFESGVVESRYQVRRE